MNNQNNLIDRILNEVDIVDFIGRDIDLIKRGNNYVGLCPFHEDTTPSYTVNREKKYSKCFSCNEGGNVISYYQKKNNVTFKEALRVLAKEIGIEVKSNTVKLSTEHQLNQEILKYYQVVLNLETIGKKPREYLSSRGIDKELIQKFCLGYAPIERENIIKYLNEKPNISVAQLDLKYPRKKDFFNQRLMVPIFDDENRVAGFSGRTLIDESIKYLNSVEDNIFQKRKILYNLNNAKLINENELYIVEGFFDVISLAKLGIYNAVALMGTAFTQEHIALLKKYRFNKITLILDQDNAGQNATIDVAQKLIASGIINVKVINFEKYKDIDELISNEALEKIKQIIIQKKDYFQYRIDFMRNKFNLNDIDQKTSFLNESIKNLNFVDEDKQINLVQYLSKITGIEQKIILNRIQKMSSDYSNRVTNSKHSNVINTGVNVPTDDVAVMKYALESKKNCIQVKYALENGIFMFKKLDNIFEMLVRFYDVNEEYDYILMLDFLLGDTTLTSEFEKIRAANGIDLKKVPRILTEARTRSIPTIFKRRS